MTNKQSHDDGTLSETEYQWLVARGRGGFAVVKTCAAYVADTGRTWTGQLGIASDEHLPGLTRLAQGLQATGTRSLVQLHHGGLRADPVDGRPTSSHRSTTLRSGAIAMGGGDVQQMVEDYVAAAVRAEQAGFDGVEVHGAHGFLLAQFLDQRNQRRDGYGGTLEHRMRALVEVLTGIRSATGDGFQVGIRLSPEAKGTPLDEGREVVTADPQQRGCRLRRHVPVRRLRHTALQRRRWPSHRRLHRPAPRRHGAGRHRPRALG